MNQIIRGVNTFKNRIKSNETKAIATLLDSWYDVEKAIRRELENVVLYAQELARQGITVDEYTLNSIDRWKELLAQVQKEIKNKKEFARVIEDMRDKGIKTGLGTADYVLDKLGVGFDLLPAREIDMYISMLDGKTPIGKLLDKAYGEASNGLKRGLVDGMAKGLNPLQIAKDMANQMGLGLERLVLIARTEQARAWRMSTLDRYRQTGVVRGFKRVSARAKNTCLACLLDDGKIYDVASDFSDHPAGLCTLVPILNTGRTVNWETGEEWLSKQSDETQRKIMGNSRYELYKAGTPLADFYQIKESEIWGPAPAVVPLKDLNSLTVVE